MSIERLQGAVRRLEAAAARVGHAASSLRIPSPAERAEIQILVERHAQLREQVRSAIGRLDTLIDTAES